MNHHEPQEYTPKQLDIIRRRAEELLQEAAERALSSPGRRVPEQVQLGLDWEPPSRPDIITFLVRIVRNDRISQVRCEINLGKLQTGGLEKILGILSARHVGTDNAVSVTHSITWLLETSIGQSHPEFSIEKCQAEVRELLLAEPVGTDKKHLRVKRGE